MDARLRTDRAKKAAAWAQEEVQRESTLQKQLLQEKEEAGARMVQDIFEAHEYALYSPEP